MSDIFDEVDDILNEVNGEVEPKTPVATEMEKNFNDSELQDIMAEIENLEKEFETEEIAAVVAQPIIEDVKKTDLQNEIDRELEMSLLDREEEELAMAAPKILSFEKKEATVEAVIAGPVTHTSSPVSNSEISFEAHGQMNLNLGFKVGGESAKLTIDPVKGLVVTMSGVELCINQEDGCVVSMENGVKFTIPLTSNESGHKKKSA